MSNSSFKNIYPVVPVYKGANLFIGALESIEHSGINFSEILVSFNGSDVTDFQTFERARLSGKLRSKYIVLRTHEDLSAVDHALFILSNIKNYSSKESMLLLLAHDDRILPQDKTENTTHFLTRLDRNTVYFPSYNCCIAGDYQNVTHVIEFDQGMTPEKFFWLSMSENVATNMSGMVVPLSAWEETLLVMKRSRSGARFEHMMTIARDVNEVRFHKNIKVLIGERPDSDGKQLTSLQHRIASLYYLLLFVRNKRLRPTRYLPYVFELAKKITVLALCKLRLLLST